jgi:hypothetical protein
MTERTLKEEVVLLWEENKRLRELLEQALACITKLEAALEQVYNSPPSSPSPPAFVKASTPNPNKDGKNKPPGANELRTKTALVSGIHPLAQCSIA